MDEGKMSSKQALLFIGILALLSITMVSESYALPESVPRTPLSALDFAYARSINVSGNSPLYSLELPEDVYLNSTRDDLGDIRVLNSEGQAVPHEVVRSSEHVEDLFSSESIPFFPIDGGSTESSDGNSVQISEDSSGKVLSVRFRGSTGVKSSATMWYLLDLRGFKKELVALKLQWPALDTNQIVPFALEASDNLSDWRSLASNGVLAKLSYQGQEIEQSKIECRPGRAKFLRIRFPTAVVPAVQNIAGEFVISEQHVAPTQWFAPAGAIDPKSPDTVSYDTLGHIPARSFRVRFTQTNTLARITLSSRASDRDSWTQRFSGSVYRFSLNGADVESPAAALGTLTSDRFWMLKVSGKDTNLGSKPPVLELGWQPLLLQFLAQGSAPFQLVYGSAIATPADFGVSGLVSAGNTQTFAAEVSSVGPARELGGVERLVPPVAPTVIPWKKWVLWIVLTVFLVAVGTMTVRLWKDLAKS